MGFTTCRTASISIVALLAVSIGYVATNKHASQWVFGVIWKQMSVEVDQSLAPLKRELLVDAHGDVLELGSGTGVNFKYLAEGSGKQEALTSLTCVEPNEEFHASIREEAATLGLLEKLNLTSNPGPKLPFPDNSFDVVFSTMVLCSVPHPEETVSEVLRVLRPGGKFLFLEHVRAQEDQKMIRATQRFLTVTKLWAIFGDGCDVERDTGATIRSFSDWDVDMHEFMSNTPLYPVKPHVMGSAVKRLPSQNEPSSA